MMAIWYRPAIRRALRIGVLIRFTSEHAGMRGGMDVAGWIWLDWLANAAGTATTNWGCAVGSITCLTDTKGAQPTLAD